MAIPPRLAVELLSPRSGINHYGLLGATFMPTSGLRLTINVSVSDARGAHMPGTRAPRHGANRAGLPAEYVAAIIEGIVMSPATNYLGPGYLYFGNAAFNLVGSAPFVFRQLAGLIVAALTAPGARLTAEGAAQLLD